MCHPQRCWGWLASHPHELEVAASHPRDVGCGSQATPSSLILGGQSTLIGWLGHILGCALFFLVFFFSFLLFYYFGFKKKNRGIIGRLTEW